MQYVALNLLLSFLQHSYLDITRVEKCIRAARSAAQSLFLLEARSILGCSGHMHAQACAG